MINHAAHYQTAKNYGRDRKKLGNLELNLPWLWEIR